MNFPSLFWWIGVAFIALSGAMALPLFVAMAQSETGIIPSIGIGMITSLFLGGAFIYALGASKEEEAARSGIREIVLLLVAWWVVLPVFAGIPFWLSGFSFAESWFEAVSAMTTTGGWLRFDEAVSSPSLMIWRAEMQWLGGLVSLSAAAAVFVRPEFIGVASISTPFSRGEEESYLLAFRSALINFTPLYALITLTAMLLLSLYSVPLKEAFVLGLSLPASGGFIPAELGVSAYDAPVKLICVIIMALSAVSFVSVVNMLRVSSQKIRITDDLETPAFLVCVLLVGCMFTLTTAAPSWGELLQQLTNATSVLSTNGVLMADRSPALAPVLVTTVIGGAAISTAGGLKLIRWIVTFRRAGQEIWKLIHPSGISGRDQAADELAVWIHYIAFTVFLAVLVLIISMFGHPLEVSATAAVAAISNAGPLLEMVAERADYDLFNPLARVFLALGMIIGRLEMVIALALFNSNFWRS